MSDRLLEHLARLVTDEIRHHPSATGIADVLWMGRFLAQPSDARPGPIELPVQERPDPPPAGLEPDRAGAAPPQQPAAEMDLHPFPERRPVPGARMRPAATIRLPAVTAIRNALEISRALRPLKREVPRSRDVVLAEDKTAALFGETGLIMPVWNPARERWLQADLVVDTSSSMAIWRRTAMELQVLLEHHGAFRNVRTWAIDGDAAAPCLVPLRKRAGKRAAIPHSPAELADPAGRRAVLVLTDAVGGAWRDGTMLAHLLTWAQTCPLAIVQVLPRRLWSRTALRISPVTGRNLPTSRPLFRVRGTPRGPAASAVPTAASAVPPAAWVPVLHLSGEWLGPWAAMVAGISEKPASMFAVPLHAHGALTAGEPADGSGLSDSPSHGPSAGLSAAGKLRAFEEVTSPQALELAGYLAAAPLTLPIMRLVQQAMLPGSGPDHLAEVFLSGLIVRDGGGCAEDDPDDVAYEFRDGVREQLLARITQRDSLRVLDVLSRVSDSVARRFGNLDFQALADLASGGQDALPPESMPFARIAAEVLRGLGGAYADMARALSDGNVPLGDAAPPGEDLHTEVIIEAALSGAGMLDSCVRVAGNTVCRQEADLPVDVISDLQGLGEQSRPMLELTAVAGRLLAHALLDESGQQALGRRLSDTRPGATAEVVLVASAPCLSLPVELIRLATNEGEVGPLGMAPGVSIVRRMAPPGFEPGGSLPPATASAPAPGPLKILLAIAAPDETRTGSASPGGSVDVEAEMAAVLDATSEGADGSRAQVRALEVASLAAIRQALAADAYHVLHLSAHGSAESLVLEDEDGAPVTVTSEALMDALSGTRPVPLIVALASPGAAADSAALARGLIARGADRVIAMLAPGSDAYATTLTRRLYQELSARPALTVGQALARARYLAEEERSAPARDRLLPPGYGIATLFATGGDAPLVDPAAHPLPLSVSTTALARPGVRELPPGYLIGRRAQFRDLLDVLRRTDRGVDRFGAASGVVLTGVGGIGKTALAGAAMSRLRDDGWQVAAHEGRWHPTALISSVSRAIAPAASGDGAHSGMLAQVLDYLADPGADDGPKLDAVAELLRASRLLIVFDGFEQNLTPGGDAFLDPATDDAITRLSDAVETGALLFTSRYPLPGLRRPLAQIPVPALSAAETRRMFLRLPALSELGAEDSRLLTRTIGGHPQLIEFTDALLRGGRSGLRHVQVKLRDLARQSSLDLAGDAPLASTITQAMVLASADILLAELLGLLTPRQTDVLRQAAVCHGAMSLDDLAFALARGAGRDTAELAADVGRLTDLTLLAPGEDIAMPAWTADLVARNMPGDPALLHERALSMRLRRIEQNRGGYEDLIDIPRHLAALRRFDDVAALADEALRLLPGTLASCAYLAEIRSLVPDSERAWTYVVDLEAQALLRAGDLRSAMRLFQVAHQRALARAAADPASNELQRDLCVSHGRLGDIARAAGDLAGARRSYLAALDIARRLLAAEPGNTQWQRDVSINHERLGDTATAAGDLSRARSNYHDALDIASRLAAADPSSTQWQRDLSITHNKLGDVAIALGDMTGARASYQSSLDIARGLAAADPANTEWQRDLSVSHNRLGGIAVEAGDLPAALASYQAGLDIRRRLAAADPDNTEWQRDLSISHERLGDIATSAGDLTAARAHYQESLQIARRLAAADPANTQWQRDLSITHNKLGDLAAAAGDLAAALASYQAALDTAVRLAAADPANTQWQRDLSISHERLGGIAAQEGDLAAALASYQAGLDITRRLAAADPANTQWQRDLSISHERLGDIAIDTGDLAAALIHYQDSLEIAERLAAADPANTQWQHDLSVTHARLGDIAAAAGSRSAARHSYQSSLDIITRLARLEPGNPQWQSDLSWIQQRF